MLPVVRQFVELLPEPSFLTTPDGCIRVANTAFAELLGIPRTELPGRSLCDLVTGSPDRARDYLRLCRRSRQLLPGSLSVPSRGGRTLDVRCDGALLQMRSEEAEALLFLRFRPKVEATDQFVLLNQKIAALSREILERRKTEQQRDQLLQAERTARLQAEEHSRMKDEFLATLSHELRTPLSAILGWTAVLEEEGMPQSIAEGVAVIARNARVQKQLIEDLLDMNRIISGKLRLDVQRVDLASVIEAAVATIRPGAEAKGVRLQVTMDPLAGPVRGDPARLQQVFWNLLSNAVKFTPKGGRVQVALERVNSHLEISVADTGEGIKPEFLPHVFDRFRQADSSTTRRHGGLGIGLSIAKQLTELHGGNIRAKSVGEGMGATFVVLLPLIPMHGEDASPAPREHPAARPTHHYETPELPALNGVRVLVIDDEPDARELMRKLLVGREAIITTAASAAEALAHLDDAEVDVIVSDIGMPNLDGYEFMRRFRATNQRAARTAAIALTAFARSEDRTRAMLAGFNLHLSKPVEPAELVIAIGSLAGRIGGAQRR